MNYNLLDLGIMVVIISFLGFIVENLWLLLTKGYINNRNMNAPFLLGYGLLVLFLFFVIGTPAELAPRRILKRIRSGKMKYIAYFICSFIAVCIGEILLGMIVERLCCIEYWNYSNLPMHITKYTSVPTSTGFACMITIFMDKFFPPLMNWISQLDSSALRAATAVLLIIMVLDFLDSFYHMIHAKNFYLKWKIELPAFNMHRKMPAKIGDR